MQAKPLLHAIPAMLKPLPTGWSMNSRPKRRFQAPVMYKTEFQTKTGCNCHGNTQRCVCHALCNLLLPLHVIDRTSKHTLPGLGTSCKLFPFTQAGPSSYRLPNMLAQPGPPWKAWHKHDQTWLNMSNSQSGPFRSNLKPQQHWGRGCTIIVLLSLVVRVEELAAIVLVGGQVSGVGHIRQLRLRCSFDKERACGCCTKHTQPKAAQAVHVRQTRY